MSTTATRATTPAYSRNGVRLPKEKVEIGASLHSQALNIAELATQKSQRGGTITVSNTKPGVVNLILNGTTQLAKIEKGRVTALSGTSLGRLTDDPSKLAESVALFADKLLARK